jgi:hypothetical protein
MVESDQVLEYEGIIIREIVGQLQCFLSLNKGPGIFLRVRLEAVC